jgi:poly-gamma-glutamate synthesis protein (capsule biosynthesis protein)
MKIDGHNAWHRAPVLAVSAWVLLAAAPGSAQAASAAASAPTSAPASEWPARSPEHELALKITAPFTLAAVGDIIEPQPLKSQEPGYQQLVNVIRGADAGFGNMESSLVDIWRFEGPIGGTEAPLETGPAIRDMGITIMNHANNHTMNGGVEGMYSTDAELDKLGIAHAGTGRDLTEARAPRYLETPKGRVGIVGMFSIDDVGNYGPNYSQGAATYRVGRVGGNPGVNVLHLTDYHIVSSEQLQILRKMKDSILGAGRAGADSGDLKFYDDWYRAGGDPGAVSYAMNPRDEADILKSVHDGKLNAEFMIATIHAHQTSRSATQGTPQSGSAAVEGASEGVDHTPPDFLIKLAHDCIDNGADIFIAHGVHALHGIEIYKGKPILYGISNFVFQFGLQYGMMPNPSEDGPHGLENPASQETVLVTSHYDKGRLTEIRIYPVDLGGTRRTISQMGIPMTPSPEVAQRILKEMQTLSKPFGTTISIENNVGIIRPNAS